MTTTFALARKGETNCSTWGELSGPDGGVLCKILERGPKNPTHPRIPAGTYEVDRRPIGVSRFDVAFKALMPAKGHYKGILWLPNVPGRSNIEIHTANLIQQLEGCLATGESIRTDDQGDFAIEESKLAYARVYPLISMAIDNGGAQLVIIDPI